MKSLILCCFIAFSIIGVYGQDLKKYYLGGHFSYGKVSYSSSRAGLTDSQDYSGKNYYTVAIDYAYRTSERSEFITGISATLVKMDFTNKVYWKDNFSYTYDNSFGIFSVPIGVRYYFGKYVYTNVGVNVNYHPYNGYKWGLGGFAGIGAGHTFKSGLSVFLTPQVRLNMLGIGSGMGNFDDKLLQLGCNIGVGYRF